MIKLPVEMLGSAQYYNKHIMEVFLLDGDQDKSLSLAAAPKSGYLAARNSFYLATICIAIILGVPLKIFTIFVAVRHRRDRVCALNWTVISLMVAGICHLLLLLPFDLAERVQGTWSHGDTFCKIHSYLKYAVLYALAYNMLLIAVNMLLEAILPAVTVKLDKPIATFVVVATLWIVVLLANIPNYLGHGVHDKYQVCYSKNFHKDLQSMKEWHVSNFVFLLLLPMLGMAVCTISIIVTARGSSYRDRVLGAARTRRGLAITSGALTLVMLLLWLPLRVLWVMMAFGAVPPHDLRMMPVRDVFYMCTHAVLPLLLPVILLVCINDYFTICAAIFLCGRSRTRRDVKQDMENQDCVEEN